MASHLLRHLCCSQDIPGGGNKFVVRRDAVTALYVTLANPQTESALGFDQRNVLQLLTSPDLTTWCAPIATQKRFRKTVCMFRASHSVDVLRR